jgi:general L-amino acid transport system permease protein
MPANNKQPRKNSPSSSASPFSLSLANILNDERVLLVIAQIVFVMVLVGLFSILWINIGNTMSDRGLTINFSAFQSRAGFGIADSPEWYSSNSTYGEAFSVGVINTLRVVLLGLVGATVLGVFIGILLLSRNWLIKTISRVYVEILRNTPLLVQLFFWYFVVLLSLPTYQESIAVPQEGFVLFPLRWLVYVLLLIAVFLAMRRSKFSNLLSIGAVLGFACWEFLVAPQLAGGDPGPVIIVAAIAVLVIFIIPNARLRTLAFGFAILMLGQFVASFLFHVLYIFNWMQFPQHLGLEVYPVMFLNVKGITLPEFILTERFAIWAAFVVIGIVLARRIWVHSGFVTEATGKPIPRTLYASLAIVGVSVGGWLIVSAGGTPETITIGGDDAETYTYAEAIAGDGDSLWFEGDDILTVDEAQRYVTDPVIIAHPVTGRFRFEVGSVISPEYTALLIGLIVYTSAFIAEIVRAGIQAVPYGQIEASRALGLSGGQTLTQIILPQALRVIIPPMGNQYLNLAKNSTLAVAIAFSDTYQIGTTIMNQSGQSLAGFTIIFFVYISLSLTISFFMNIVNSRFQLVTR